MTQTPLRNAVSSLVPQSLTTLALTSGETGAVTIAVTPATTGDAVVQLTATCPSGEHAEALATVHSTLVPVTITKSENTDTLKIGDPLDYTLTLSNRNFVPLMVSVTDGIDSHLDVISSDPEMDGSSQGRALRWSNLSVPAQGTRTIVIHTHVNRVSDEADIPNTAVLSQPSVSDTPSNTVVAHLFDPALVVLKQASRSVVQIGDRLSYSVSLQNQSTAALLTSTQLVDTLPSGEHYLPGTARLNGIENEPTISGQQLTWSGPGLKPGELLTLTYDVGITLDAQPGTLLNLVTGRGHGSSGEIAKTAQATVQVTGRTSLADIIGVIFIDTNNNGVLDGGETPIPGVRVLLAGGREALTDADGRYHFADLPSGPYALYVDPASLPLPAAPYPGDRGTAGARLAQVMGLTQLNIPLQPPTLQAHTVRFTTLTSGPVTLLKTVTQLDDTHFRSTTTLNSSAAAHYVLDDHAPADVPALPNATQHSGDLQPGTAVRFTSEYQTTNPDPLGDPDLTITVMP
ncbi:SdrD B-like domain-containing protein [Deinococcus ruber]|nr:SdrD B-like domain-containing protein [Deinococcus ruber]